MISNPSWPLSARGEPRADKGHVRVLITDDVLLKKYNALQNHVNYCYIISSQ